jgi:hypothetical protein
MPFPVCVNINLQKMVFVFIQLGQVDINKNFSDPTLILDKKLEKLYLVTIDYKIVLKVI